MKGRTKFALVLAALTFLLCGPARSQTADGANALKAGRYVEAMKLLLPPAKSGDAQAQRLIGEMYFNGQGVAKDVGQAVIWSRASADRGDRLAQYTMGYFYETGVGVLASRSDALEYYKSSALQEYLPAQVKSGDLLALVGNISMARYWYEQAARAGSTEASSKLAVYADDIRNSRAEAERREYAELELARQENQRRMKAEQIERDREATSQPTVGQMLQAQAAQMRSGSRVIAPTAYPRATTENTYRSSDRSGTLASSTNSPAPTNTAPKLLNIIESNPYEQYPDGDLWAFPKKPWKTGGWTGEVESATREQACRLSMDSLAKTIAEEERTGYYQVTQKSSCVCRTGTTSNRWDCRAYFQSVRTGKTSPSAVAR